MPLRRKPLATRPGVGVGVDQVARRGDLRAGHPAGEVAARIGRRRVELQRGERKFFRVGHVRRRGIARSARARDAELLATGANHRSNPATGGIAKRRAETAHGTRRAAISRPPKRGEVGGALLAVDRLDAVVAAERDQRRERDLRRVGAAREHRLAEEHPAERDAVEAAGELAVDPGLDAVHAAGVVPGGVGVDHLGHDPGAASGRRAAPSRRPAMTRAERAVDPDLAAGRGAGSGGSSSCSDRASLNSAGSSTMRGSGDHQSTGWPSLYQGKMPLAIGLGEARAASSSPPAATRPGASLAAAAPARRRAAGRPARCSQRITVGERRALGDAVAATGFFCVSATPFRTATISARIETRSRPACGCRCRGRSARAGARSRRR